MTSFSFDSWLGRADTCYDCDCRLKGKTRGLTDPRRRHVGGQITGLTRRPTTPGEVVEAQKVQGRLRISALHSDLFRSWPAFGGM